MKHIYDKKTTVLIASTKQLIIDNDQRVMMVISDMKLDPKESRRLFLNDPTRKALLSQLCKIYQLAVPIRIEHEIRNNSKNET